MTNKNIKIYKKESDYSYVIGASPTIELIKTRPDIVESVIVHSKFNDIPLIKNLCSESIELIFDDKIFTRLNITENNYVIGLFGKYRSVICDSNPHVMLVNPSDMGNLGSIIRTLTGFGFNDLAVITPAADIFNPKTIRASMGAIFKIRFQLFNDIDEYRNEFNLHKIYPFMLDSSEIITHDNCPVNPKSTLVFGNESCGLPDYYKLYGTCYRISQSANVDSLNLSVAVGIGTYIFAIKNNLL